jgi:hypothetical protein
MVIGLLSIISIINLTTYLRDMMPACTTHWVYADEITQASEYVAGLPGKPYVYFFSNRLSFNYETRRYLASDVSGEDRSLEFGPKPMNLDFDTTMPAIVLLLPPYQNLLPTIQHAFPGETAYSKQDGAVPVFTAYRLPLRAAAGR